MSDKPENENEGVSGAEDEGLESAEGHKQEAAAEPELSEEEIALQATINEAVQLALSEQQESVLRAKAEVQNMRRRCEQDVERAHKYALEKFSAELLSVADNLERALQSVPEEKDDNVKSISEGVELTLKGFIETLAKFKVEQINPQGEPFDPQMHEAMSMLPNPEVEPNTVMAVVQKGYTLNGRVLRPAMVVVSKAI